MKDLILHAVIFAAWLSYTFPPLACSETNTARRTRVIIGFVLSACIGASFGFALTEVL